MSLPLCPPPFFAKSRYSVLFPPAASSVFVPCWASIDTANSVQQTQHQQHK